MTNEPDGGGGGWCVTFSKPASVVLSYPVEWGEKMSINVLCARQKNYYDLTKIRLSFQTRFFSENFQKHRIENRYATTLPMSCLDLQQHIYKLIRNKMVNSSNRLAAKLLTWSADKIQLNFTNNWWNWPLNGGQMDESLSYLSWPPGGFIINYAWNHWNNQCLVS